MEYLWIFLVLAIFIVAYFWRSRGTTKYPKILWIYWDSVKLPPLISAIREYNEQRLRGWDIRYLSSKNLDSYIPLEAYPPRFPDLIRQHQADWIRLYLLKHYGGVWMDSGIIVNDGDALDTLYTKSVAKDADLTGFGTGRGKFVHENGKVYPLVVDNWFIMAPASSRLIDMWFTEYDTACRIGLLVYKKKAIKDGVNISKIHSSSPDDIYLTQHICIQKLLQKTRDLPPTIFEVAGDSMFKLQSQCRWKAACIQQAFDSGEARAIPWIKLTKENREELHLLEYLRLNK